MKKKFIILFLAFFGASFCLFALPNSHFQESSSRQIEAYSQFKAGVFAFYHKQYANAILHLEKASFYTPKNQNILSFKALVYFYNGQKSRSLDIWKQLLKKDPNNVTLKSFISKIEHNISLPSQLMNNAKNYIPISVYNLKKNVFPTMMLSNHNGGFYVPSFGEGTLKEYDINGQFLNPFVFNNYQFKQLFSVIFYKNNLLASDFSENKLIFLSPKGQILKTIKSPFLKGPQFLATDKNENIYVSSWANQSVIKFNSQGQFLFSFGQNSSVSPHFTKLQSPTGLAIFHHKIYVVDQKKQALIVFDQSGNYLSSIILKLPNMEGISYKKGKLYITSNNNIYIYTFKNKTLSKLYSDKDQTVRFLKVHFAQNNELMVSDFTHSRLITLAPEISLMTSIYPQIFRFDSSQFPKITIYFKVTDFENRPIIGLKKQNFFFLEDNKSISAKPLYENDYLQKANVAFLINNQNIYRNKLINETQTIQKLLKNPITFSIVNPNPLVKNFGTNFLQNLSSKNNSSPIDFRKSLQILSNDLLKNPNPKRTILFFSNGDFNLNFSSKSQLVNTATFLKNNNITFDLITYKNENIDKSLNYLVLTTGGQIFRGTDTSSFQSLQKAIKNQKTGVYIYQYISPNDAHFGQKYINLTMQVRLRGQSGQDKLGYFSFR